MSHLIVCLTIGLYLSSFIQVQSLETDNQSRVRRTPNKFESLRRREREQRLIELGALITEISKDTPSEIRVYAGDTVFLPCRVIHVGTQSVNWEHRGMVLSIDTFLATSLPRISVSQDSDTWRLAISSAQESDAGVYKCSVRTTPPLTREVTLHILQNGASIMLDTPYQQTGRQL